jgi:hypothetical protein
MVPAIAKRTRSRGHFDVSVFMSLFLFIQHREIPHAISKEYTPWGM